MTLGGLRLRVDEDVTVVLTGAHCDASAGGRPIGAGVVSVVRSGEELRLGRAVSGLRTYIGVRGGIDVPLVLGSRSTDVLSGLGPPKLARGARLPVGDAPPDIATFAGAEVDGLVPVAGADPDRPMPAVVELRIRMGPRADWFTDSARDILCSAVWTVTPESNRVGMRLTGTPLQRVSTDELPSEGVVRGALQVPPAGLPTLFLADHPVTGGYPVIAVVLDADVDRAAQVRPGRHIRFRTTQR